MLEKEPEERKEEQPERVQKQRVSRQALWARRGLPQNTYQEVPFRLQGCVCVYVHTHMKPQWGDELPPKA